jgi:hypothetical protein
MDSVDPVNAHFGFIMIVRRTSGVFHFYVSIFDTLIKTTNKYM